MVVYVRSEEMGMGMVEYVKVRWREWILYRVGSTVGLVAGALARYESRLGHLYEGV